jgi:hypothetical protein
MYLFPFRMMVQQDMSAKLLSTGTLEEMHSLMLVAEGMVVTKLKTASIVNAVICLPATYYVVNAEYPKGVARMDTARMCFSFWSNC